MFNSLGGAGRHSHSKWWLQPLVTNTTWSCWAATKGPNCKKWSCWPATIYDSWYMYKFVLSMYTFWWQHVNVFSRAARFCIQYGSSARFCGRSTWLSWEVLLVLTHRTSKLINLCWATWMSRNLWLRETHDVAHQTSFWNLSTYQLPSSHWHVVNPWQNSVNWCQQPFRMSSVKWQIKVAKGFNSYQINQQVVECMFGAMSWHLSEHALGWLLVWASTTVPATPWPF